MEREDDLGRPFRNRMLSGGPGALREHGRQKGENPPARGLSPSSSASVAVGATEAPGWKTAMNFIDDLSRCDINHRGLFFDFGSEDSVLKYGWNITPPQGLVSTRYDGSTWSRVYDKRVRLRFFLPEPSRVFIAMRARGRDASRARVLVDGYSIAALSLNRKRPTVIKTRLTRLPLDAGLHELVRLGGAPFIGIDGSLAEIDWVRIAGLETDERTYGPYPISDRRAASGHRQHPARAIALVLRARSVARWHFCSGALRFEVIFVGKACRCRGSLASRWSANRRCSSAERRDEHRAKLAASRC